MSLSNLARMAEDHNGFIAVLLANYPRAHALDDPALAQRLYCSVEDLVHLH